MKNSTLLQIVFVGVILIVMSSILFAVKLGSASQASSPQPEVTWQPALVSDQREATVVMRQQFDYLNKNEYDKAFGMMAPNHFQQFPMAQVIEFMNGRYPEVMHSKQVLVQGADTNRDHSIIRLHLVVTGQNNHEVQIDYLVFTGNGRYMVDRWKYPLSP